MNVLKKNIVLIGMPGCGKTLIGRLTAKKTGRVFIDTDELITGKSAKSVPELFREIGENGFRDLESEAVREAALSENAVIATGGGTMIREENRRVLENCGTLIWLRRDVSLLEPDGRPLSNPADRIYRLYDERLPLYIGRDVYLIYNDSSPEKAADDVSALIRKYGL